MEIAIVDCLDEAALTTVFPEKYRIVVFCVSTEGVRPGPEVNLLRGEDVPTPDRGQLKFWMIIKNVFDIGYACGRFNSDKVTVFTDRPEIRPPSAPFTYLVEPLHAAPQSGLIFTPSGPPISESIPIVRAELQFKLISVCFSAFVRENPTASLKPGSVKTRLRDWAGSLTAKFRQNHPQLAQGIPPIDDLIESAYADLVRIGVLVEDSMRVKVKLPSIENRNGEEWLQRALAGR